jgi:hypothetical protein
VSWAPSRTLDPSLRQRYLQVQGPVQGDRRVGVRRSRKTWPDRVPHGQRKRNTRHGRGWGDRWIDRDRDVGYAALANVVGDRLRKDRLCLKMLWLEQHPRGEAGGHAWSTVRRMRQTARGEQPHQRGCLDRGLGRANADLLSGKHIGLQDEELFVELGLRFGLEDICRCAGVNLDSQDNTSATLCLTFIGQHI